MGRRPASQPPGDEGPALPGLGPVAPQPQAQPAHIEADTSTKFSPSKLDTYKECPRRYRYRYVDGLRRRVETAETLLGSSVHKALEELYAGLIHGREFTLEETLAVFDREWTAGWSDAVLNRHKEYGPEHHQASGRDCVRNYFRAYAPFRQETTLAVEKRLGFTLSVEGQSVRIEGLADRIAVAPSGAFAVHDYKTTTRLPGQADLDEDWQLAIYDIAVREAWPEAREVGLLWHFVRFGRTMSSRRDDAQREALRRDLAELIARIKRDHAFAPRRSALCDWCEYRDLCPLWRPTLAESAPLARAYAAQELRRRELRDKLHELELQMRELEDDIVRFAEARGIERLAGPDGEVSVSHRDDYLVPSRTHEPELYAAIEARLKQTPLWQQAARIDLHRLLQGYERGEWGPEGQRAVEEMLSSLPSRIQRVRRTVVRFRQRKEEEPE